MNINQHDEEIIQSKDKTINLENEEEGRYERATLKNKYSKKEINEALLEENVELEEEREEERIKETSINVSLYFCQCNFSKRYFIGVVVLLLTVLIWVLSSELIQYIYNGISFDQPFFLTYFDTTLFSLYLLGFLFMPNWQCTENTPSLSTYLLSKLKPPKPKSEKDEEDKKEKKLSTWETAKIAFIFYPVWFIANYLFNVSLNLTSVASTTIISVSSGLWTLILAAIFGAEKFSIIKTIAVFFTIAGVCLVGYNDKGANDEAYPHPILGDILSLISAIFYAIYIVLLKVKIKDENRVINPMFFGFVGLFNVLTLWPIAILLNFFGIEVWVTPDLKTFGYLLVNGVIGTALSDYLWLMSVLLTSPVVATLGLSLTIPFSMIADFIIYGTHFDFIYILGSILVLIGFVIVNTDNIILSFLQRMWIRLRT